MFATIYIVSVQNRLLHMTLTEHTRAPAPRTLSLLRTLLPPARKGGSVTAGLCADRDTVWSWSHRGLGEKDSPSSKGRTDPVFSRKGRTGHQLSSRQPLLGKEAGVTCSPKNCARRPFREPSSAGENQQKESTLTEKKDFQMRLGGSIH